MKLLVLASYAPSLVRFRGWLLKTLVRSGHEVDTAAPAIDAGTLLELQTMGVTAHELPMQRTGAGILADLTYMIRLRKLMRRVAPDFVLTYTIKPNIWGAFAAASLGVPSAAMVTGLGYAFSTASGAPLRTRLVQALARRLYRAATDRNGYVIFQNPDDRDDFLGAGCLRDQSKIIMVNGSGVDLAAFPYEPIRTAAPTFLLIARLLGAKGIREFVQAARRVREVEPRARFIVVGWLDDNPDSIGKQELADWIEDGVIEFVGKLEDVRPAIAECSVYVLPSYREGTPRTVLEAMSMGRPIITTDAPGCRETVIEGENGFLVPPRSVDALVEAMQKFIDDPGLAARMGRRSREIAEEKYDVHKVNAVIIEALGLGAGSASEVRRDY